MSYLDHSCYSNVASKGYHPYSMRLARNKVLGVLSILDHTNIISAISPLQIQLRLLFLLVRI